MNRVDNIAFRLLLTSLLLCFAASALAQTSSPSPEPTKSGDKEKGSPFAPEKAPPLPKGMTGSNTNDPRTNLKPGFDDAGEAAMGIKHIMLLKKPGAFQLGSGAPNDPKVQKILGQIGNSASETAKSNRPANSAESPR